MRRLRGPRFCRLLLPIFLILVACPTAAEDKLMSNGGFLVLQNSGILSSTTKDILVGATKRRAFTEMKSVDAGTQVTVLKRDQFRHRETVYERGEPLPKDVTLEYKVAHVRVDSGALQGKTGWVVVSYLKPGLRTPTHFYFDVPKPKEPTSEPVEVVKEPKKAVSEKPRKTATTSKTRFQERVDLKTFFDRGRLSPTGGRLYQAGVINRGLKEMKGRFVLQVEVAGRVRKKQTIRGPIRPNGVKSFTVHLQDHDLNKWIKVSIVKASGYEDANPGNDSSTMMFTK
jgi:hypothetical protein